MTALDDVVVARIRHDSLPVQFEEQTYTIRASNAREGLISAELELVDDRGEVLGYFTSYGSNQRGAVKSGRFGVGAPALFRSLEDAIAEILR
jgi:hypothetical protein